MLTWLEGLTSEMRDKLAQYNVIDPIRAAAGKEVLILIGEWEQYLRSKGNTNAHVKESVVSVTRLFKGCNWNYITDASTTRAQQWLLEQRRDTPSGGRGLSAARINAFIMTSKHFFNWLKRERRIAENPLAYLKSANMKADRRRERRSLTQDEIGKLLAATEVSPTHHGMTGMQRSLLYPYHDRKSFGCNREVARY